MQRAVINHWQHLFAGDVHFDCFPRRPQCGVDVVVAVEVAERLAAGASNNMQHIDRGAKVIPWVVIVDFVMDTNDLKIGHLIQLGEVSAHRRLASLRCDIPRQHLLL